VRTIGVSKIQGVAGRFSIGKHDPSSGLPDSIGAEPSPCESRSNPSWIEEMMWQDRVRLLACVFTSASPPSAGRARRRQRQVPPAHGAVCSATLRRMRPNSERSRSPARCPFQDEREAIENREPGYQITLEYIEYASSCATTRARARGKVTRTSESCIQAQIAGIRAQR